MLSYHNHFVPSSLLPSFYRVHYLLIYCENWTGVFIPVQQIMTALIVVTLMPTRLPLIVRMSKAETSVLDTSAYRKDFSRTYDSSVCAYLTSEIWSYFSANTYCFFRISVKADISSSILMGLAMCQFIPALYAFFLSSSNAFAVMATMVMFAFFGSDSFRIVWVAL